LSLFDASIRISSHHFAGSSSRFCTVSWSLIFFQGSNGQLPTRSWFSVPRCSWIAHDVHFSAIRTAGGW
jgi:hypothetical protein